jgi:RNA polymerase sigma factor (sigma-70 family)
LRSRSEVINTRKAIVAGGEVSAQGGEVVPRGQTMVPSRKQVFRAGRLADAHRLEEALARLPDAQAEVITLAYYGQLSHAEIAAQLGLPSGTVKGRMRLGLKKLRQIHTRAQPDLEG